MTYPIMTYPIMTYPITTYPIIGLSNAYLQNMLTSKLLGKTNMKFTYIVDHVHWLTSAGQYLGTHH